MLDLSPIAQRDVCRQRLGAHAKGCCTAVASGGGGRDCVGSEKTVTQGADITRYGARARAYIYMHSERLVQLCDSAVPRKKPISRSADTLPRSLLLHYLGADSHAFPVFSTGKGAQLSRNLQRLVCSPIGVTAVAGQPAGRSSRSVRMLAARAVRGHRRGRV